MLCKTTLIPLCKIHRFLLCIGEEKSFIFVYQITTDNLASQFLNFINPANFSFPILVSNFSHISWKILLYISWVALWSFYQEKKAWGGNLKQSKNTKLGFVDDLRTICVKYEKSKFRVKWKNIFIHGLEYLFLRLKKKLKTMHRKKLWFEPGFVDDKLSSDHLSVFKFLALELCVGSNVLTKSANFFSQSFLYFLIF